MAQQQQPSMAWPGMSGASPVINPALVMPSQMVAMIASNSNQGGVQNAALPGGGGQGGGGRQNKRKQRNQRGKSKGDERSKSGQPGGKGQANGQGIPKTVTGPNDGRGGGQNGRSPLAPPPPPAPALVPPSGNADVGTNCTSTGGR